MRLVGHAAHMCKKTNAYRIVVENLKVRDDLKDLGIDGRMMNIMKPTRCTFHSILLRITGLYTFRALLAHPQEVLHKWHFVYCVHIMSTE
jgi:hypothetical protein